MFWVLPWYMIVVVWGTIAQKYVGLYQAQNIFFDSFVIWLGFVPLPGGLTCLIILGVSLLAKFLTRNPFNPKNAGGYVSHLAVLILLAGGAATFLYTEEGSLTLVEGESGHLVTSFHERVLFIRTENAVIAKISREDIETAAKNDYLYRSTDLQIRKIESCVNCTVTERAEPREIYKKMAAAAELKPIKPELEDEANFSGVTVNISGLSEDQNGGYLFFELIAKPLELELENGEPIRINYQREKWSLPFDVTLSDFQKTDYPGLSKAKEYASHVSIIDGDQSRDAYISMNNPLRYRGYTIFQSSYAVLENGDEVSVFTVVKNPAWIFPYLATSLLALGLIMSLLTRMRRIKR